jgi:autotransporter translocation and assembly factor TamB
MFFYSFHRGWPVIGRIAIASLLFVCCAVAQTQTIKGQNGKCQVTVPSGGVAAPGLYQAFDKSLTVMVDWDTSGLWSKRMTDAELKQFHYVKALENTDARLWAEKEPTETTTKNNLRVWHVYMRVPGGICHCGITFKTSVSEDAVKKVVLSLGPSK